MDKLELYSIMLFPLYVAIGVLVFSLCMFAFNFELAIIHFGMVFALGSVCSEVIIIKLCEEDLKYYGMW